MDARQLCLNLLYAILIIGLSVIVVMSNVRLYYCNKLTNDIVAQTKQPRECVQCFVGHMYEYVGYDKTSDIMNGKIELKGDDLKAALKSLLLCAREKSTTCNLFDKLIAPQCAQWADVVACAKDNSALIRARDVELFVNEFARLVPELDFTKLNAVKDQFDPSIRILAHNLSICTNICTSALAPM